MNNPGQNLVTTYVCKSGREYIVKMRVVGLGGESSTSRRNLDITVTDKHTAEKWQSSYDVACLLVRSPLNDHLVSADIENLTQKTGNYKQFDIFVAMLQSGLLKTSDCVSLDLLTFDDLELLRCRRTEVGSDYSLVGAKMSNRRYLIITYNVEFDRIHYPLPLEYCGLPDTAVLQSTIRKLEAELERLRSAGGGIENLCKKLELLTAANKKLVEENHRLSNGGRGIHRLLGAVKSLERSVAEERASFRSRIQKLRTENSILVAKLHRSSEAVDRKPRRSSPLTLPFQSRCSMGRRRKSRSALGRGRSKSASSSPGSSSVDSIKSIGSPRQGVVGCRRLKTKEIDFGNLESRIHKLQKMLKDGININ
ncbi:centrosomal protein CCDC61 isoform X1 [Neodiprion pinetum]|uniref:Centrosomal protein CCDC61-like isoform X1 n=1 Tax=Neodiprion lecontei TaxID=441921 RepID=A0ABM3GMY9_NEOLC|nr:centrosomal protein CCDC61-like isoform X1 [Neodiprion pinetum]XP_046601632.1 centrosomal protein CCDC61-like isoform X1 [Neodiprion lecontei]